MNQKEWESGWYHGTTRAFDEFSYKANKSSGTIEKSGAIFFTKDINFANDYTKINDFTLEELAERGLRPNVRPVDISYNKAWDHRNPEHRELIKSSVYNRKFANSTVPKEEAERMTNMMLEHGSWRWIEPEMENIKSMGFDAIKLTEQGKENIALFNDSQIRSKFFSTMNETKTSPIKQKLNNNITSSTTFKKINKAEPILNAIGTTTQKNKKSFGVAFKAIATSFRK